MSERDDKTFVHFGFLASNTTAPVINNYIPVEDSPDIFCYDAVIFPVQNVIIVDCSTKLSKKTSEGFLYSNQFYYYKISDGSFIKTLDNEMFIPFQEMKKRQLEIFTDIHNDHTFLLRSYLYDGVDAANVANTYVDIFMIADPLDPWIMSVVDRSFLGSKSLQIAQI